MICSPNATAAVFFLLRQPSISISDGARSLVARAFGHRFHHAIKAEAGGLLPRRKLAEGLKPLPDIAGGGRGALAHWHPISTAPCNRELELRISEDGKIITLEFPCLQTNAGAWINVDLGSQIELQAVEWRVWQRKKSPESHHSMFKPSDRSALLHHDPRIPKRDPIKDDQ
jgi:hypothetical protein